MNNRGATWETRCVIYDCDGVLFDSFEANSRLYNDLCALVGRSPLEKEETKVVHTHTVYEAIHFIFRKDEDSEKRALEIMKQVDLTHYIIYLKMEPHLLQALGQLKDSGMIRVINTNRTTSMKEVMNRFCLWPFFDMVVTALDVKNPKPHPESVEKILQAFDLKREEAVFVGDSEVDQQAARSAGIKFVAYKNKELESDLYIEDHLELLGIISDGKKPQQ
jgi:HAD superfamily hydrolase (TIGR01509 family)